jgi:hypothetical protein
MWADYLVSIGWQVFMSALNYSGYLEPSILPSKTIFVGKNDSSMSPQIAQLHLVRWLNHLHDWKKESDSHIPHIRAVAGCRKNISPLVAVYLTQLLLRLVSPAKNSNKGIA